MPKMLDGRDIVCFASQDWISHLGVPQQLMARLAQSNRVIYIDPPRSLSSAFNGWARPDVAEMLHEDVAAASNVIRRVAPSVSVPVHNVPPRVAPLLRRLNRALLAGWFRRLWRELDIRDPIYWVFEPTAITHLPGLPAGPVVYDCIDEWAGYFPRGSRRHRNIAAMDAALARRADVVFVAARTLLEQQGQLNRNTHLVYHAADFAHFHQASLPDTPRPKDMPPPDRPVIGLMGILDKRVDVDTLSALAERRRDWQFVLIGPVQENLDVGEFLAHENVMSLGMKSVAELPAYVKGFDVCLIPYLIDDFVRSIYPLKLHEYLASGRPVVSTPIPAVLPYDDIVHIAEGADGFEAQISAALSDTTPDRVAARIDLARANTWEARVAEKSAGLMAALER